MDLESATVMSRGVLTGLDRLCDSGIDVTIRGSRSAISELTGSTAAPTVRLVFQEV